MVLHSRHIGRYTAQLAMVVVASAVGLKDGFNYRFGSSL